MMPQPIRAIYEAGQIRLLDPVDLADGQEVKLLILPVEDPIRAALGDLLAPLTVQEMDPLDEEALQDEIDEAFAGRGPISLSDDIIEERKTGP